MFTIFTDASVNPKLKVGVGGYLILPDSFLQKTPKQINKSILNENIVLKKFQDTSSTKLEVQTVLWALSEYSIDPKYCNSDNFHIYTDSQCVEGLLPRRSRLESNDYHCKQGDRLLKNASLYSKYYEFHDKFKFDVTKVEGHTRKRLRNTVQHIFSAIDQKVRKALKLWVLQL
ncbi:ribonuclease H [Candidatus Magnetomorum sp. HK-1]|nr:ribonuclease H [Candidatus Magnetomorum sp. HK-1]